MSVNAVSVSDSIIANIVTFGRKRSPRMLYPLDSIGADTIKKGYIDAVVAVGLAQKSGSQARRLFCGAAVDRGDED